MNALHDLLLAQLDSSKWPLGPVLVKILGSSTGLSSSGYPYLAGDGYAALRDDLPHILGAGWTVYRHLSHIETLDLTTLDDVDRRTLSQTIRVVRAVCNTAAITAPADLWLLRSVLSELSRIGVCGALLANGVEISPKESDVAIGDQCLRGSAVAIDLDLLVNRGLATKKKLDTETGVVLYTASPPGRPVLADASPLSLEHRSSLTALWVAALDGTNDPDGDAALLGLGAVGLGETTPGRGTWVPAWWEIELGYRVLPIVLALNQTGKLATLANQAVSPGELAGRTEIGTLALQVLSDAGIMEVHPDGSGRFVATAIGRRVFQRGPGPFGIIEAYTPYLRRLVEIWRGESDSARVRRGANVAASQLANSRTFSAANHSLDAFCRDTGFSYRVFIEHALGHGEATRQRFALQTNSMDWELEYYVGADLEDAAVDAALQQQRKGLLPASMAFVRHADIGKPELLLGALSSLEIPSCDAVMIVGNGFHEVRETDDEQMVEVFRGYRQAGLILIFTEENALSTTDLRHTAWNTYHAGFRYVHDRSGQALRPSVTTTECNDAQNEGLRTSWSELLSRAGYVRLPEYCSRTRTIYPCALPGRHNPAISVNHFAIPRELATRLAIDLQ